MPRSRGRGSPPIAWRPNICTAPTGPSPAGLLDGVAAGTLKLADSYHIAVAIGGRPIFDGGTPLTARNRGLALNKVYPGVRAPAGRQLHPVGRGPWRAIAGRWRDSRWRPGLSLTGAAGPERPPGPAGPGGPARRRTVQPAARRRKRGAPPGREAGSRCRMSGCGWRWIRPRSASSSGISAADQVFYSAGLWTMLGHDPAGMPPSLDCWQSLIHPDDLADYRARIEAQRAGAGPLDRPRIPDPLRRGRLALGLHALEGDRGRPGRAALAGDRHGAGRHRAGGVRAPAAPGQGRGRRRLAGQERVPRLDVARDPHADERRSSA